MGFVFDKCCCCIELRTGCLIIGYLNLVANILIAGAALLGLIAAGTVAANGEDIKIKVEDGYVDPRPVLYAVTGILLVLAIIFLAFNITLLVGLHQNKRGHIKAYLIYAVIFTTLYVILDIVKLANTSGDTLVGNIFQFILVTLLNIYFLLVIRSQYVKLGESSGPAIYRTA